MRRLVSRAIASWIARVAPMSRPSGSGSPQSSTPRANRAGHSAASTSPAHAYDPFRLRRRLVCQRAGADAAQVYPPLFHRLNYIGMDSLRWARSRRRRAERQPQIVRQLVEHSRRHLAASGVVDAHEQYRSHSSTLPLDAASVVGARRSAGAMSSSWTAAPMGAPSMGPAMYAQKPLAGAGIATSPQPAK